MLGSSGKLNLMFRQPIRWKHGTGQPDSDAAFRFVFAVDNLKDFEAATLRVTEPGVDYEPGYMQIYCEGAAMRQMGLPAGVTIRHHLLRCASWQGHAIPCETRLTANTFSSRLIVT